jgi:hypothetical protein
VKHVVNAVIKPRFFNRSNIRGLFYHTDQPLISGGAGAIAAGINICDIAAYGTKMKFFFKVADGRGQLIGIFSAGAQNVKCQTLGALAANARKFL